MKSVKKKIQEESELGVSAGKGGGEGKVWAGRIICQFEGFSGVCEGLLAMYLR